MSTRTLGDAAEERALNHLLEQGLNLVTRNFSSRMGEIDLIMTNKNCLVFVEVRMRNNPYHGSGAETVTPTKIRRIIKTAEFYLKRHPLPDNFDCRFDVVSIDDKIDWIENAFTLDSF